MKKILLIYFVLTYSSCTPIDKNQEVIDTAKYFFYMNFYDLKCLATNVGETITDYSDVEIACLDLKIVGFEKIDTCYKVGIEVDIPLGEKFCYYLGKSFESDNDSKLAFYKVNIDTLTKEVVSVEYHFGSASWDKKGKQFYFDSLEKEMINFIKEKGKEEISPWLYERAMKKQGE